MRKPWTWTADRIWTNADQIIGSKSAMTKIHEGLDRPPS